VTTTLAALVRTRADAAGLDVSEPLCDALAAYLALLARWNRKVNLTSFDLDAPSDAAIDRLAIEPIAASSSVRAADRLAIDVGSGGGSPAIPLRLARPDLAMVLVEVRERKAAFLREAARTLGLDNVSVEVDTFERVGDRRDWAGCADLVTMRAVRADPGIWRAAEAVLRPSGRFLWFSDGNDAAVNTGAFAVTTSAPPVLVLERSQD
jgi:16S rRNA (guanine527-N7)-methyltransferase